MSPKSWIWAGLLIFSTIGGYIPTLFGASLLSGWSIVGNTVGGLVGIWIGYKLGNNFSV